LSRNIGNHPSQIAHADTPFCQKYCSPGRPIRLAVAHVAIIMLFASIVSDHVYTLNGLLDRSNLSTVFVSILAQEFNDCCLIFIISSTQSIHLGNHGKFSTTVVVVNCHQAAIPQAINHSNIKGFSIAFALYIAAVCPAGHDHIITIFSIDIYLET